MSILQRAVERLVGGLKHDASYRIVGGYSDRQLLRVLWHRGRQWMRGLPLRVRVGTIRGAVFRGRRVVVEHAAQVTAGPSLILEDGVSINALSIEGVTLGANVTIARYAQLTCTGVLAEPGVGIVIGNRCAVGAGSFLGGQGGIRIGDDVILGPAVRVFSENHRYDRLDCPIRAQGQRRAAVMIGSDCWIGAGATILAGVTIGSGCVVAAGAVVTNPVPPMSVVAGVPARVIKSRLSDSGSMLAAFAET